MDHPHEQAPCAWWNSSTPGRIRLLNRRAKKLTCPKWSVEHLMSVPASRADQVAQASDRRALANDAVERVGGLELRWSRFTSRFIRSFSISWEASGYRKR